MGRTLNRGNILTRWMIATTYKLATYTIIYRWIKHSGPVIFVSSRLCIKSTPFGSLAEAETLHFVSQNTTIPVPKVYCAFVRKGRVYILMRRIKGQSLFHGWVYRPQESKDKIIKSLGAIVEQLQNLPNPKKGAVCNVSGGPIYDQRLPNESFWGPFPTVHDFHVQLSGGLATRAAPTVWPRDLDKLLSFYEESCWPDSVLTHGDLSASNIMADGDKIVGIVDWETAGWMPPYWEYTSAWNVNPYNKFWQEEVEKFIPPMPEALEMETIRRKYFGDF